jgi:serine/threonine-protein kinase HipA
LLVEGNNRRKLCRQTKIDPEDDFGLLLAIGEDCAGALSILPRDKQPEWERKAPEPLGQEDINRLVRSLGKETLADGSEQRFSLAGVQEKQPVIYEDGEYALPDQLNPSSHILKFETEPRVCFAEYIANRLASKIGLPVVVTEFLRLQSESIPYLRIERYDRYKGDDGQHLRMHQEDLIQALGYPPTMKYQKDGGPGIREVAELLRAYTARPVESLALLRDWQLFNYLVGNWDGHGKNLALLYQPGNSVPELAPFYDLVAIEFFNLVRPKAWARDVAFYIGEHTIPEKINRADWERFADDLSMPRKRLLARLEELATLLPDAAAAARGEFAEVFGDEPVYDLNDYMQESIRRRCHWVTERVLLANTNNK